MAKFFKFATAAVAFVLMAWWSRSFVVERRLLNADRLDVTDIPCNPDKAPEFAWTGTYNRRDSTTYQIISYDKEPMTGSRGFKVNGSPVQGKLKAYLYAATAEQELPIVINHPDGESSWWVEMPMPLYLSLTDQSPSQ